MTRIILVALLFCGPKLAWAGSRTTCNPNYGGGFDCDTRESPTYSRHSGLAAGINAALDARKQQQPQVVYVVPQPAVSQPVARAQVGFCPEGGERYAAPIKFCPMHGVELRALEN